MPHAMPTRSQPRSGRDMTAFPACWQRRFDGSRGQIAALAMTAILLGGCAGCQTPAQPAYPAYGGTVPSPGTGMIGQPAPYGSPVAPQGVVYPAPGPSTTAAAPAWQGAPPAATAPANNWTWAQSSQPTAPPTIQQYGTQLQNNATQYTQGVNNQAQQYANQLQAQPQQYANQTQQQLAGQQQQLTNQLQNTTNQYTQSANNQLQQWNNQLQQNLQTQPQQITNQLQQGIPQVPQQQTANGSWWPFTSPAAMPPVRSIPAQAVKY